MDRKDFGRKPSEALSLNNEEKTAFFKAIERLPQSIYDHAAEMTLSFLQALHINDWKNANLFFLQISWQEVVMKILEQVKSKNRNFTIVD